MQVFLDRREAGRALAESLRSYAHRPDVLVLALPRGGVPVGVEVARGLDVALDVLVVRKLGLPGQEELAMGAVASGGVIVVNKDVVDALSVADEVVGHAARVQADEVRRREARYRGERPWPALAGRTVILVDDGLATGSTMTAAILAVRDQHPARIVVAAPVAAADTAATMSEAVDDVVCLQTPRSFLAVGEWYLDFSAVSDDEVRALLREAWSRAPAERTSAPHP